MSTRTLRRNSPSKCLVGRSFPCRRQLFPSTRTAQPTPPTARTHSASARPLRLFEKRGQLLPRERVARLLDPGVPFLELSTLAGWQQDQPDPAKSIAGGGTIAGIGVVAGTRVMLVADDAGIDAGALQPMGLEKLQRAPAIALGTRPAVGHL